MNRKEVMGRVQLDLKDFKTSKYIDGLDVPGGSNAQDDDFRLSQLNVPTRQVILDQFEDVIVDEDPFAHIEMELANKLSMQEAR